MEPNIFDKIHDIDLKKTMETSYIDYAMSVIAARALPDVRMASKQCRRVLYSMVELNNGPDKPTVSQPVSSVIQWQIPPHGDSSIYGALVNMAQKWATRYPLVDGHKTYSMDGGFMPKDAIHRGKTEPYFHGDAGGYWQEYR